MTQPFEDEIRHFQREIIDRLARIETHGGETLRRLDNLNGRLAAHDGILTQHSITLVQHDEQLSFHNRLAVYIAAGATSIAGAAGALYHKIFG